MEEKRQRAEEIKASLGIHSPNLTFNVSQGKKNLPEVTLFCEELKLNIKLDTYLKKYAVKSEIIGELIVGVGKCINEKIQLAEKIKKNMEIKQPGHQFDIIKKPPWNTDPDVPKLCVHCESLGLIIVLIR